MPGESFAARAARFGTWARIGLLWAGCVGCVVAFDLRQHVTRLEAGRDPGPVPDSRFFYTAAEATAYLDAIGPRGRELFADTQLTLDLLFPALYGGLFVSLVARLCPLRVARCAVWLPVAAVACDLGENVLLAAAARRFDGRVSDLAAVAAYCTAAKWVLLGLTGLAIVVGGLSSAVAWLRRDR